MLNTKKRGLLASAGALVTAVALALGGAAAAQAVSLDSAPEKSGLVITKLEQPEALGGPATGAQLETLPGEPIRNVTFEAYRVKLDNPALSDKGQQEMANMTVAEAQTRVGANPQAERAGKTGENGEIRWEGAEALDAGLWLIRETATPAGVVAAGDFLVALPLTEPVEKKSWLPTVYVYPKNHTIGGQKSVNNEAQLTVGEVVTWTISIDNPSPRDPATGTRVAAGKFEITDVLTDDELTYVADSVEFEKASGLAAGTDFDVVVAPAEAGKTAVTVVLNESGLKKIVNVPGQVTFSLKTKVNKSGEISNIASFTTSNSAPKPTDPAVIKYGDFELIKESEGAPANTKVDYSGAQFMVFADKATADAALKGDATARKNSLRPLNGGQDEHGVWTTNDDGRIVISGLRYSDYANGAGIADEANYQTYWLVETKALENHQLLTEPVPFKLTDKSKTLKVMNQYDRGGFVLPLTGGTGTIMLTVAGIALLAVVLIVARRRQHAAE